VERLKLSKTSLSEKKKTIRGETSPESRNPVVGKTSQGGRLSSAILTRDHKEKKKLVSKKELREKREGDTHGTR